MQFFFFFFTVDETETPDTSINVPDPTNAPARNPPVSRMLDEPNPSCKRKLDMIDEEEAVDDELPPKPRRFKLEILGNSFSKDAYVHVENYGDAEQVVSRETFPIQKFPRFLGKLMSANPDISGKIIENFVCVLNHFHK